jgi:copper oxidase (laccase) domain-containing protein
VFVSEKPTTLGFTTREGGLSMYPEKAFNMARYVDDRQENITHHQTILANMIVCIGKTHSLRGKPIILANMV